MITDIEILYSDEERILHSKDLIGDWEFFKAKRLLEEVLENDPLNDNAHYLMGYVYHHHYCELDLAFQHYEKAVRITPQFMEAIAGLVSLANTCQQPHVVLKHAIEAGNINSAYQEKILIELAFAYEKLAKYKKAMHCLKKLNKSTIDSQMLDTIYEAKKLSLIHI